MSSKKKVILHKHVDYDNENIGSCYIIHFCAKACSIYHHIWVTFAEHKKLSKTDEKANWKADAQNVLI